MKHLKHYNESLEDKLINKEYLNDLEDILLELKDERWVTEISGPTMRYSDILHSNTRPLYTLLINKDWIHGRIGYELKSFTIQEISETILRIIDYLISKGINYKLIVNDKSGQSEDITDEIPLDLSEINIGDISLRSIIIKFWK